VNLPAAEPRPQVNAALARMTAPAGAENISLTTADGYTVAGWYWRPVQAKGKSAPPVLLLHQRAKDKGSWDGLPATLLKEGFAVLAIDLRGHGETTDAAGNRGSVEALTDADYKAMLRDVKAAHDWLLNQRGLEADRLGIIGASIGANLGIIYAASDRRVRTVVALSPGLDYRGLKPLPALDAYDKRPLYLLVSKRDSESYAACEKIKAAAVKAKPVSLRAFDGADHGTDLLQTHRGLDSTIATGWLLNYLPPGH
jgi:dienelactone hydrolase